MSADTKWSHYREWPPEPENVRASREFVSWQLTRHALPELTEDAALVVSELATNVIRHARTPFEVTLERSEGTVRLCVHDASPQPPFVRPAHPSATRGRGLRLVGSVSSSWGVDPAGDDGKVVWASFEVAQQLPATW